MILSLTCTPRWMQQQNNLRSNEAAMELTQLRALEGQAQHTVCSVYRVMITSCRNQLCCACARKSTRAKGELIDVHLTPSQVHSMMSAVSAVLPVSKEEVKSARVAASAGLLLTSRPHCFGSSVFWFRALVCLTNLHSPLTRPAYRNSLTYKSVRARNTNV